MKKVFLLTFLLSFTFTVKAQSFLSLDSCRALALANNKDLLISNEKISAFRKGNGKSLVYFSGGCQYSRSYLR